MVRIEIDASDLSRLNALLDRLFERARNVQTPLQETGEFELMKIDDNFASESDPYGTAWAARKGPQRPAGIGKILQQSGAMRASAAYAVAGRSVQIGLNSRIARYHQNGTSKMTARKMIPDQGLPGDHQDAITNFFEDHFRSAL